MPIARYPDFLLANPTYGAPFRQQRHLRSHARNFERVGSRNGGQARQGLPAILELAALIEQRFRGARSKAGCHSLPCAAGARGGAAPERAGLQGRGEDPGLVRMQELLCPPSGL